MERSIDTDFADWTWIQGLQVPAVVLSLEDRTIIAINPAALSLLNIEARDTIGKRSSWLIPDDALPGHRTVSEWTEQAEPSGMTIEINVEPPGSKLLRLTAHLGPASTDGRFAVATLRWPEDRAVEKEEALMGLMSDIGRIVGSSLNLEAVSQQFAISLMHIVPAEHVAILLSKDGGGSLTPVLTTGQPMDDGVVNPVKGGPIERAIKSGAPILVDEDEISSLRASGLTAWPKLEEGLLTSCCVPLIAREECIGVVLLASATRGAFGFSDLQLLEYAGNQVAGAISNVMLHEQIARAALEREVLANIGRAASAAIEFDRAMPKIASEIERYMPISELCVYEPDDQSGTMVKSYSWTDHAHSDSTGEAEKAPAAAEITPLEPEDGVAPDPVSSATPKERSAASITASLRFGGEAIGALTMISAEDKPYSAREATFGSLVANQIAGAVHTARAYRNEKREANLRRSLAQISLAASRDLASDNVFERIAAGVAELVSYDLFTIALLKPDRSGFTVRVHKGAEKARELYEETGLNPADSIEWHEHIVRPVIDDPRFGGIATCGIKSLVEVSLGTQEAGGATGYLLIGSKDESTFLEQDLKTLAQVAMQVTPAIQNATAYEQAVALAEAQTAEARVEARNVELEKISDAKSQFLSVVSHELRTPLTSIIAYAELLARNTGGNLNEKQLRQAGVINKSAMHLKFLISDLLDVSRIESGNLSLEMSTFEVGEALRDVLDQFEPVLAEKHQTLRADIPDESILLRADRYRIAQVMSNLVENASKYSPPETTVAVSVRRNGSEALIEVIDQGVGISDEDQQQLFVPFFRANSKLTRAEPGTGLGLSLVKSIAEMHGGRVALESEPGKGSTFQVMLPTVSAQQAA